ncbi:energy-coupling factor transporter transmembrane component T family protein [Paenibacillus segetis]|uniref:Cobalt ABC transporter permease n=1 Tax=Paenibacillus segetis TaxID=1325360 RepID=A0ABQ1YRU7_9BACL|nr:energy-coupling factor transporter transmembrane component T [Paenibacillus segetis]GGH34148.1 cobalt ABC transporter permease [Paenibacillus segetis]
MREFLKPRIVTWMHQANPVTKLVLVVLAFFITLFTHNLDFMMSQTIMFTLLLFFLSGHSPWKVMLITMPFLLVFVSSSSTMILFGKGDHLWWKWGLIRISEESFFRGIHIGFKSVSFGAEGLLFVLTTQSVALFYALMQKAKLPPKYAYSFMASIRLLPMVWEEYQVRRNALYIREVKISRGPRGWIRQAQLYAVPLLAQSIRRAHRVAVAMEAKAFDGRRPRTFYYLSTFSRSDLWVILILIGAFVIAYVGVTAYPTFGISDVRYR